MKIILIGGTSHVGKSTVAEHLADKLGWQYLATDSLCRHPGRPWDDIVEVPSAVKEYYLSKSPAALVEEVVEHYLSNVWPIANAIIQSRINNRYDRGLVMEGSALLPEQVVSVNHGQCQAIWLTAPPELITERILERSGWHKASNKNQQIISSFLDRSLIFNQQVIDDANRLSQKVMDVSEYQGMDELIDRVAALMLADTKIW